VLATANVTYTVTATGTGLTYQWRKNGSNLSNAGKYSGVTTATLTITGVDSGEAGTSGGGGTGYDCVVSGTAPCSAATSARVP